jgi:hypothetical protein
VNTMEGARMATFNSGLKVILGPNFTTFLAVGGLSFAAAQSPDAIPRAGLELWIRADSVKIQDGKITQLYDLSGKQNHPKHDTQNGMDPLSPAQVLNAHNGKPTLRFNSKYTGFSFTNIGNIRTVIAVLSKDSTSCLPTLPNYKTPAKFFLGQDDGVTNFHPEHGCSMYNANLGEVSPLLVNGKTYVNGKVIADGRKTFFPFKLGVVTMAPTGNVKANTIARDRTMSDRSWQGDISELLIYSVPLDEAVRVGAENFLMAKYGIGGSAGIAAAEGAPRSRAAGSGSTGNVPITGISFIRPNGAGAELFFSLAESGQYSFDILDLRGRRILALAGTAAESGAQQLLWDGNDTAGRRMAPGTFLADLISPSGAHSKRLFLLR